MVKTEVVATFPVATFPVATFPGILVNNDVPRRFVETSRS